MDQLAFDMSYVVGFYRSLLNDLPKDCYVCEIGAGRGNLTAALVRAGFNVLSCEPSEKLVELARNSYSLNEKQLVCMSADKFIAELGKRSEKIGAFFLWHVIEHLENPQRIVISCAEILKENGFLILQAPLVAPRYLYPEHRFLLTTSWVHRFGQLCGLEPFFIDISYMEQFVSFCWGASGCSLRLEGFQKPIAPSDPIGAWLTDLTNCIFAAADTIRSQKHLVDLRDAWIAELLGRAS